MISMDILRRRFDKNYVIVYSTRMIDGRAPWYKNY